MTSRGSKPLNILQLYPRDMNIYGDWGNTLTLLRRAKWHGYSPQILDYNLGGKLPDDVDLIIGGGGQDSGQNKIHQDLLLIGEQLKILAEDDVPMLMVCGLYQLFGRFFKTVDGQVLTGIRLFDIETHASDQRLVGNVVCRSELFGEIVGYENHSGLTYLGKHVQPLAKVVKGAGNNGQDQTEGAIYRYAVGSYLHGSLLPKNPSIADWLLERAALRRYGEFTPNVIDDRFATKARAVAARRPR